ncbi:MAG: AbrB/MazE/SpoVT family DNA-binding domain-containing protein [Burkholderiaceae bacterium]
MSASMLDPYGKWETMMAILTVTERGQVTLRKEILNHLGIKPGDKIEVDLLPHGKGLLKASEPKESIDAFVGVLKGRSTKVASVDELNEAVAESWAGRD